MPNVHYPRKQFKEFCKKFKDTIDETKIDENDDKRTKQKSAKKILMVCTKICIKLDIQGFHQLTKYGIDLFWE